ncbi:MAG: hypothetical protein ABFS09_13080 [Thermodesulfobacteriota bacterium]
MYDPAAFLISITALTSIFSFFFGGYYHEREKAYRFWLKFVAYEKEMPAEDEAIDICTELESRDRMFYQAKGLLTILLLTIVLAFIVFQFYSFQYILKSSPLYEAGALRTYLCFNAIVGSIVMINCLELLYIRVAIEKKESFPYFILRKRILGQERLSKVWMLLGCSKLKSAEYNAHRIPKNFYDNQDLFSEE